MVGRKLEVYCPNCEEQLQTFTEVTFLEEFKVLVKAQCCGHDLQVILEILNLLPTTGTKQKRH